MVVGYKQTESISENLSIALYEKSMTKSPISRSYLTVALSDMQVYHHPLFPR